MNEQQWLACEEPGRMLEYLLACRAAVGVGVSPYSAPNATERKLRLFACACCRLAGRPVDVDAWEVTGDPYGLSDAAWASAWARNHAESQPDRPTTAALLRDLFGNPFRPPPVIDPAVLAWNGGTVRRLAEHTYRERAFDRLPLLADALLDAGCEDEALLAHCRGTVREFNNGGISYWYSDADPGGRHLAPDRARPVHVRGCWAVDLLLGKE